MDIDIKIENMTLQELQEFARTLVRLARVDNELIKTMRDMLDILEKQQGE